MKHYSQCLFYALTRWKEEGGELVFVKSTHWAIPHVQHRSRVTGNLTQFVPPEDLRATWHCLFGFYGEVVEGDSQPRQAMSLWGMFAGTVLLGVLGAAWAVRTKFRETKVWPRQRIQKSNASIGSSLHTDPQDQVKVNEFAGNVAECGLSSVPKA